MKLLKILFLIFSTFIVNLCFAEQTPSTHVILIKELQVKEINFENLPKESKIGSLLEFVNEPSPSLENFLDRMRMQAVLHPFIEDLVYVNNVLCHVGNYPQSIIYTVLEGAPYGLQTTVTYDGILLYVNYDYEMEYTPAGIVLHHYYSDSEVITGANQVIVFY